MQSMQLIYAIERCDLLFDVKARKILANNKKKEERALDFLQAACSTSKLSAKTLLSKLPFAKPFLRARSALDPSLRDHNFTLGYKWIGYKCPLRWRARRVRYASALVYNSLRSTTLQCQDWKMEKWQEKMDARNKCPGLRKLKKRLRRKMVSALLSCFHGPAVES